jgi:hypothetical protein
MANLSSLTVNDTGNLTLPSGTAANRPSLYSNTAIQWTNTGSQAYSVLAGSAGTISNTSWTAPTGVNFIEVLVVAGGGAGGSGQDGGGGGAGGLIYNSYFPVTPGTAYTVTVGAGGTIGLPGGNGSNSVFGSLTAIGGGGGASYNSGVNSAGVAGGSGGGGARGGSGGTGTTGQGFAGGIGTGGSPYTGGGGGGAGGAGKDFNGSPNGGGGLGINFSISGTPTWYAGGGGGGQIGATPNNGGQGGGGIGGFTTPSSTAGTAGTASTGGGGGGAQDSVGTSGAGGSGTVIIRYTLESSTAQLFGKTRFNTLTNLIETFGPNNSWNSGQVLFLDPGNAGSYSGSGSTWNDLSGFGNNATLVGSPTFNAGTAGGTFALNGTSQYAKIPISSSINSCQQGATITMWLNMSSYSSNPIPWNNHIQGATNYGPVSGLIISINTSGALGTQSRVNNICCQTLTSATTPATGTWFQVVSVWDGGNLKLYYNGSLVASGGTVSGVLAMINDIYLGVNADTFKINGTTVNMVTGSIGLTSLHNRGLSAAEVFQSFQTYRSRYGI